MNIAKTLIGLVLIWPMACFAQTPLTDGADRDCEACPAMMPMDDGSALGVYPVTVAEFRVFAEETGVEGLGECFIWTSTNWCKRPETGWTFPNFEQADDHPAVCVSWLEATAFADWLSEKTNRPYRLPTLEEAQATALAGAETEFWWGSSALASSSPVGQCSFIGVFFFIFSFAPS